MGNMNWAIYEFFVFWTHLVTYHSQHVYIDQLRVQKLQPSGRYLRVKTKTSKKQILNQLVVIQNVSTNLCSRGTELIFEIWQILFLSLSQSIISGFVLNAGVMYNQHRDDAKIKKSLFKSHTVFTPEKSCGILQKISDNTYNVCL